MTSTPLLSRVRAEILPLIRLSVPLMIGLFAATAIWVVDTVMIAPLGTVPLAAAGITAAVLIILISALWGLVTVVGVQIATVDGAGNPAEVSAITRNGLALALFGGGTGAALMIAVLPLLGPIGQPQQVVDIVGPYWVAMAVWIIPFTMFFVLKGLFDATGRAWVGVALSYLAVLVNVPANYSFIHILDLGILGAGLASILSQTTALIAALIYWRIAPSMAPYRAPSRIRRARVMAQAREGLPLCIGYAGEGGAYAFIGIMIGWLGATPLAAHQVAHAIAGLAYVIPLGMAGAVSIRIGNAVGAETRERLRAILLAGLAIVTLWQSLVALTFILGGPAIATALSQDAAVITLASALLLVLALMQVIDGVQSTALGALRGLMDNRAPTAITLLAYWPAALPAAYLVGFVLGQGAVGVWLGYTVGIAIAAIALPWRFWRRTRVAPAPH